MKNSMTVLLAIEDQIEDSQLEVINKVLKQHKEFSNGTYKVVNWATYKAKQGKDTEDDNDDLLLDGEQIGVEVADNYMRAPRAAILQRKQKHRLQEEIEQEYQKLDKEKVESTVAGLEAFVSAWLSQERSTQNLYIRKKALGGIEGSAHTHYKWLRKPRFDLGAPLKPGETGYFYDRIANGDLVIALVPVFLVLVFILNLIA